MVYLSANGVVLGQFAESAVPSMLAEGTVTKESFFWRVGMSEWRPVTELAMPPVPEAPQPRPLLPKFVPAPLPAKIAPVAGHIEATPQAVSEGASVAAPAQVAAEDRHIVTVEIRAGNEGEESAALAGEVYRACRRWSEAQGLRLEPATSVSSGQGGFRRVTFKLTGETAPVESSEPAKPQLPRRSSMVADSSATKLSMPERRVFAGQPSEPEAGSFSAAQTASTPASPNLAPQSRARSPGEGGAKPRQKSRLAALLWLVLFAAAAGGGTWWWLNRAPAAIPGKIVLAGDETGPLKVRVYRRADLTVPWREQLAVADARSGELDKLVTEAGAELREKTLLFEEAARVCQVGEEFNMPDVEKLRADRDAKKASADAARAKLEEVQGEKDGLVTVEALLDSVPAPLQTLAADEKGIFAVPVPGQGEVVLLATAEAESNGRRETRGWLEVLAIPEGGDIPAAVEFSGRNRLDLEAVRRFAAAPGP